MLRFAPVTSATGGEGEVMSDPYSQREARSCAPLWAGDSGNEAGLAKACEMTEEALVRVDTVGKPGFSGLDGALRKVKADVHDAFDKTPGGNLGPGGRHEVVLLDNHIPHGSLV